MAFWVFAFEETEAARISRSTGVNETEAVAIAQLVARRFRGRYALILISLVPLIIGIVGALMALDGALDIPGVAPWVNVGALITGSFVGAAGLSLGIVGHFRRQVDSCLQGPACFRCGYSLAGLPAQLDDATGRPVRRVLCPECTFCSPVSRQPMVEFAERVERGKASTMPSSARPTPGRTRRRGF